jgi:hypothetical protein
VSENRFETRAAISRVAIAVSRINASWLEWCVEFGDGMDFDSKIVEVLVGTLDAHAEAYLEEVRGDDDLRPYLSHLRLVGRALITNAEQNSHLQDPYSEKRLRQIAESSGDYLARKHWMTAEQQEVVLAAEIEKVRDGVMEKSLEWNSWHVQITSRIETRFEARYAHWAAEAMERIHRLEATMAAETSERRTSGATETKFPRASRWEDVHVRFISDHRFQVFVNQQAGPIYGFEEFGLTDGRTGTPRKAWDTLRKLADNGGTLDPTKMLGPPRARIEKRVEEIRKPFRRLFQLEEDPLSFSSEFGYRARFQISCQDSYNQ